MSTAVVIGSGSAGRRHALALLRARPDSVVAVVRRPDSDQPTDQLQDTRIRVVHSVDEVPGELRVAVVASPATLHAASVEALAPRVATLLLEKPVAASIDDAAAIARTVTAHRLTVSVGYHLRCTETVLRVHDMLHSGVVGEVSGFTLSTGQHLRLWRPAVDANRSVSARVELGGGVLNELSHEIDAVRHLFGDITAVSATLQHDGAPTDGVVDTVADLQVRTARGITGTVHLDMVSDPPHRRWQIVGDRGTLHADLLTGRIEVCSDGIAAHLVVDAVGPGERDSAEDRLVANLLGLADGAGAPICTLDDGIAVVAVVEAARRSAARAGATEWPTLPSSADAMARGVL